jgi:serine/threonine protein kinase
MHLRGTLVGAVMVGAKRSGLFFTGGDAEFLRALAQQAAIAVGNASASQALVRVNLDQQDLARRTAVAPMVLPRKFALLGRIGQGGMGIVFKARHVALETVVAVKVLPENLAQDPEFVARFHREARVMAQLRHESIVRVLDIETEGTVHFFVMEYVEGPSLAEILRNEGALPLTRVIEISSQVAAALAYAHAHDPPVVHRDITPSNVLVEKDSGRVVVTDFGIAKVAEQRGGLTMTGNFFGKPWYAAPEQIRGERDVDGRADIYSLGMMMHEMFTGRHVFAGLNEHQVFRRVVLEPDDIALDFRRTVSEQFRAIVARAIAKDRGRRYPIATELLADLDALRASLGSEPRRTVASTDEAAMGDLPQALDRADGTRQSEEAATLATIATAAPTKRVPRVH